MDIEDLIRRFGVADLARAIPATEANPEASPAATLLARRTALVPAPSVEEAQNLRDFGAASNRTLFNAVFAVEPLFKQLVVVPCNRGLFRSRLTHVNTIKMMQLVSYARLARRRLLPNQAVTRASYYHALALAESLGPYIPEGWKLLEQASHVEIIEAVNWLLSEEGAEEVGLDREEWYDAEVLGVDQQAVAVASIRNIDQALVILEAMATTLPTNSAWLNGISFIGSALLALGRRGTVSDALRDRVVLALKDTTSATQVTVSPATLKRFYTMYCGNLNAGNAAALFDHYRDIIPENVIVLRNIILQAAGSGMTTYMVILRAMAEFADFPWPRMLALAPVDFARLETAIEAVGGNVYFGFNDQMAAASAKNFPNLAYAAFQLCIRAGGDGPLKDYAGKPKVVPIKPQVDQMVEEYIANRAEAAAAVELPEELVDNAETARLRAAAAHAVLIGGGQD